MNTGITWWLIIISHLLFSLVNFIAWKKGCISLTGETKLINSLAGINIKNIAGIFLLGLPLILSADNWSLLLSWPVSVSLLQVLVAVILLSLTCMVSLYSAMKKTRTYAQAGKITILPAIAPAAFYLLVRIIFLVIYECFFRGLLLFTCIGICGITGAILINLFYYSMIHAFNERSEMLACVPFGIVLCGISIYWQSLLPAILFHLLLAVTHESYILFTYSPSPKTIKP